MLLFYPCLFFSLGKVSDEMKVLNAHTSYIYNFFVSNGDEIEELQWKWKNMSR